MCKTNTSHSKTHIKKDHRKLKLLLPLLTTIPIVCYTYFSSFSDVANIYRGYPEILNQTLEEITESLSTSELNNPTFLALIDEAITYPEARVLLANHGAYPEILLELASSRPETLEFVVGYTTHQSSSTDDVISIKKDYTQNSIPLFIQWDKRWGYASYGDEFIGSSGCGPTALSMVLVGLTGDTNMHPKAVADFSLKSGYFHSGLGTSWALMSKGAQKLGLISKELPLNANTITSTLQKGHPIILSMGPGHFTQSGHFIVLTGIASDGKIQVNDPGSIINSQVTWDLDILMSETKNLWAFSLA